MLKIGVLGVGHLGKIHLKCILQTENVFELTGIYDPDEEAAREASETFGARRFDSVGELIQASEAVDIVTPTTTHFALAEQALQAGRHVFIEKPVTHTLAEAEKLLELARDRSVKVQVGHVERFNPTLLALEDMPLDPMFIEGHRLAVFNPRGTDVSVILDLMIHDLDIVLSLVGAPVRAVSASGVPVVSKTPDIANARIEFENGCIANLTASRISLKQMRKIRLFQKDAYLSLDFLGKQAQIVRMFDENDLPEGKKEGLLELETQDGMRWIQVSMPDIEPVNAIRRELETFAESIRQDKRPVVSIEDGYRALQVAYRIIEEIESRQKART